LGLRRRLLDLRTIAATDAVRFPFGKSLGLHVATREALYLHIVRCSTRLNGVVGLARAMECPRSGSQLVQLTNPHPAK
jgi:hypothetical protein